MKTNLKDEIKISLSDLEELIYFSLIKYNEDNLHRSGVSSRRDPFGAFLERWINKIVEKKIFDNILYSNKKKYTVITDSFIYTNEHEKNAPDIIGLKDKNSLSKFGYFENNRWFQNNNCPAIEIKAIRKNQNLLTIKDSQLIDYSCFVEVDFREDYITSFFEKNIFNKKIYESLISKMQENKSFLKGKNNKEIILNPKFINYSNEIGTIKLIGIYKRDKFLANSTLCKTEKINDGKKIEQPYYLKDIIHNPNTIRGKNDIRYGERILKTSTKSIIKEYEGEKYIPFILKNPNNFKVIADNSKSTLYLKAVSNDEIIGEDIYPGELKLSFAKFERSSGWSEFVGLKKDFSKDNISDDTEELIEEFDKIVNKSH